MKQFIKEILVFVCLGLAYGELIEFIATDEWGIGFWTALLTIRTYDLLFRKFI